MDENGTDASCEYLTVSVVSAFVTCVAYCCCCTWGQDRHNRSYDSMELRTMVASRYQGPVFEEPMMGVPIPPKERVSSPPMQGSAEYAVASIGLLRVDRVVDMEGNQLDLSRLRTDSPE